MDTCHSLRVMVIHNEYQQRGGEDNVVQDEMAMLRAHGHEVLPMLTHNDKVEGMSRVRLAAQTIWSRPSAKQLDELVVDFRPTLVHVHNTFPLLSPSIYWAAARRGIPVVQTLHNFRLHCPQAMYLREEKICEDCLGHIPWRGAVRGCYRQSVAQSTVLATAQTVHRALGTWHHKVDRYIALTDFSRRKFIAGGLPPDLLCIKPNFVDFPVPTRPRPQGPVFIGRLSVEKGIDTLLGAASQLHRESPLPPVRVVGTGPLEARLAGIPGIDVIGQAPPSSIPEMLAGSLALVLPSICYEQFPRTLVEAYACGVPVIASRLGSLPDLVDDGVTGLLFEPGNAHDLAAKLRWAHANPDAMRCMGDAARQVYLARYTAEVNHRQLLGIYHSAIRHHANAADTPRIASPS